jgi:hypothetical protein
MKYVFYSSLQLLFEIFLSSVNNQRVTLEMHTEMRVGLHVKYPLLSSDIQIFRPISVNFLSINFHENPFIASRVVHSANGETDVAMLKGAFLRVPF